MSRSYGLSEYQPTLEPAIMLDETLASDIGLDRPKEFYTCMPPDKLDEEKQRMANELLPFIVHVWHDRKYARFVVVSGRDVSTSTGNHEDFNDRAFAEAKQVDTEVLVIHRPLMLEDLPAIAC